MKTLQKKCIIGEIDAITRGVVAAAEAAQKTIDASPTDWYPCGFAWVDIKPRRGVLIQALEHLNVGQAGLFGGYQVYNPSNNMTQRMDAKESGARAFKKVLDEFLATCPPGYPKYTVTVTSRMD